MFTGIIEELAVVRSVRRRGNITNLSIQADKCAEDIKIGDSISLNGVCLTAVKTDKHLLNFELLDETTRLTNLGRLKAGEKLNLERALKIGGRLSGHFVTGHIDCLGIIRNKTHLLGNLCFEIAIPQAAFIGLKFIVSKGSIAVDGISLTIVNIRSNVFNVYIIPHTIQNTTLNFKGPSDCVNIEFDILAKYHQQ